MGYFHVYTKGLEDDLIFHDREDYIAEMNYVAVACFCLGIPMLAFVLMSNHFHFAVRSNRRDAEKFIRLYKQMISMYILRKYGKSGLFSVSLKDMNGEVQDAIFLKSDWKMLVFLFRN